MPKDQGRTSCWDGFLFVVLVHRQTSIPGIRGKGLQEEEAGLPGHWAGRYSLASCISTACTCRCLALQAHWLCTLWKNYRSTRQQRAPEPEARLERASE